MAKVAGRILKGDQVRPEGRVQIGVPQTDVEQTKGADQAKVIQQVRIVENHLEFALIEIICACGARALLKCQYEGVEITQEVNGSE